MESQKRNLRRGAAWLLLACATVAAMAQEPAAPDISASSVTVRLAFSELSTLKGKTYNLGEIARIDAADPQQKTRLECLVLGNSPLMGYRMTLAPQALKNDLRRQGITEANTLLEIPPVMILEREVQSVDLKMLEDCIRQKAMEEVGRESEGVIVERIQLPQAISLPGGVLTQSVEVRLPRRGVGSGSFVADLLVDGESQRKISGSFLMDREVESLVCDKPMARGQLLEPAFCRMVKKRLSQLPNQPLAPADLETGSPLTVRRNLQAGDALGWMDVERQVLVRRGQTVQMLLESSNGMRIALTGQARGSGALGDPIEVTNTSSGKIVRGLVAGEQTVRVVF